MYKGVDKEEGREVAWNVIKLDRYPEGDVQKLIAEIGLLKDLDCPQIINLYHSWIDNDKRQVVFITELMTSGTLREYVLRLRAQECSNYHVRFVDRVGQVSLKVVKNWCRKILAGLHYLHTREPPIIHRDIKCDNIFINGNSGQLKIGDLGLATAKRNNCQSIIGIPFHIPLQCVLTRDRHT